PAEVILIVGGYMSSELTSELSEVQRVIVVTRETGRRDLAELVDDLSKRTSGVATVGSPDLEERLGGIQASLAKLEQERDRVSKTLSDRVSDLVSAQVPDRRSVDVREPRQEWRLQEENLERELLSARRHRQEAELAELERLRARAESDR